MLWGSATGSRRDDMRDIRDPSHKPRLIYLTSLFNGCSAPGKVSAMGENVGTCIPTIEAQAEWQLLQTGKLFQEREEDGNLKGERFIAVIESRIFLQDCIRRSMQSTFSLPILTCSTVSELELGLKDASAAIVIVSWMEASNEVNTKVLNALSELVPNVPVVVLAQKNDVGAWREPPFVMARRDTFPARWDLTSRSRRCVLSWRAGLMCRWTVCLRQGLAYRRRQLLGRPMA